MTIAYCLDAAGYLVSEIYLDGILNTMARADLVLVTPPTPQAGTVRRWRAGVWTYEPDPRGRVYIRPDGSSVAIGSLGQQPPTDGVDQFSPEGELRASKAAAWLRVKAARDAACVQPIEVGGHVFDADLASQAKVAAAAQLASLAGDDWSIDWTLADNTTVTLTRAEVIALGVAIGQRTSAAHSTARSLRMRILATTSLAELTAITI